MKSLTRRLACVDRWVISACLVGALVGCGGGSEPSGSSASPVADVPVPVASAPPARMSINTVGSVAIDSKDIYRPGNMTVFDAAGNATVETALEIRGRGNSTWGMPKKPYRLRLAASAALGGMPANRHWVLLANYSDKTLMRNEITFALSRAMGFEYTPRSQFVELTVNGSYDGVYQLTEHIRIAPDRVNIPEMKVGDTSASAVTGGYLLEVDERRGEDFCFDAARSRMVFCLSSPEKLLDSAWSAQRSYITGYVQQLENALFGAQFANSTLGYAAYLDVDSAINYYLINELFKNVDGNLRLSTYMFKKRDGKLAFGPIWDFDLAIGNVDYGNADKTAGWHIRSAPWFTRLFEDPAFAQKVRARWSQLKSEGKIEGVFTHMDNQAKYLQEAQARNFSRWNILHIYVWPNRVVTGSYAGEVNAMKDWLRSRIVWMDTQLAPL